MENPFPKRICRLCLVKCDNFEVIGGNTKNNMDMLLLKINLSLSQEPVICSNCSEVVQKCFDFKLMCLDTYKYAVLFINDRNNPKLNLKDVYLNNNENFTCIPEGRNVCGFCMDLISRSAVCIDSEVGDNKLQRLMLQKYLPELDLNIIKRPTICSPCQTSLDAYFHFVTICLNTEEKIMKYCEAVNIRNDEGLIDLTSVLQFTLRNSLLSKEHDCIVDIIKQEKFYMDQENADGLVEDKMESFMEMDDQKFDNIPFATNNLLDCEENKTGDIIKTEEEFYMEQAHKNENIVEMKDQQFLVNEDIEIKTDQQDFNRLQVDRDQENTTGVTKLKYQCKSCSYQTKYKHCLQRHMLKHEHFLETMLHCKATSDKYCLLRQQVHKNTSEIKIYQCKSCPYLTKYSNCLKRHMLAHKDPSEVTMYHCDSCPFETKFKYSLHPHMLTHKNPSEVTIHQCSSCSFQTRLKFSLKRHMLKHKDPSEIAMYQCDSCPFQTKHKVCLKRHALRHNDPLEKDQYQCHTCPFQTKIKRYLRAHMLTHKDPSEIIMQQCDSCSFRTKYRSDLKRHMLVHRDPSEIAMQQCDHCPFETKYRGYLKRHLLAHKNSLIYRCESCPFQTKIKRSLHAHMLTHKSPSVQQCDSCPFRTKYRVHLKRHMLTHKDLSKITTYHCDICPFQTKYKDNLKTHSRVHKDPAEITMHRCGSCLFQTKYKKYLEKHEDSHKEADF